MNASKPTVCSLIKLLYNISWWRPPPPTLNLPAPGGREPRRLGGGGCGSGGQDGQVPGPPDWPEGGGGDAADLVAPPKVQWPTENFNTSLCRNFCLY